MRWRSALVLAHRYIGLAIAGFMIVSGATGAVLAYRAEIDRWLNPPLYDTGTNEQSLLDGFDVRNLMLARYPDYRISRVSLQPLRDGEPHRVYLEIPEDAAASASFDQPIWQVDVHPVTGAVLAEHSDRGGIHLNRQQLMSTIVDLHYRLLIPGEIGRTILGVAAMLWFFDHFVALLLSFPNPEKWRKSFFIRWRATGYKFHYDLHRATGVWLWGLLLTVSCTSFAYNLNEVFRPLVNAVAPLSRPATVIGTSISQADPPIGFERAYELLRTEIERESAEKHFSVRFLQFMAFERDIGVYRLQLNTSEDIRRDFGRTQVYLDAFSGKILWWEQPQGTTRGDWFVSLQAPLHVGDLVDVPQWLHQLLLCLSGVATVLLSVTGVILWQKKSRGRLRARH